MTRITKATIEDLPSLALLFDAYRIFYRKDSDVSAANNFLKERLDNSDSVIFIAKDEGGQALGFTQLYPSFSSTSMKRLWILNDLYVVKSQRGKGISKLLINAAKELCKQTGGCGVALETESNNDIGNKLYPATGFELEKNNFYFWTA